MACHLSKMAWSSNEHPVLSQLNDMLDPGRSPLTEHDEVLAVGEMRRHAHKLGTQRMLPCHSLTFASADLAAYYQPGVRPAAIPVHLQLPKQPYAPACARTLAGLLLRCCSCTACCPPDRVRTLHNDTFHPWSYPHALVRGRGSVLAKGRCLQLRC